jgi:hypothetical protein
VYIVRPGEVVPFLVIGDWDRGNLQRFTAWARYEPTTEERIDLTVVDYEFTYSYWGDWCVTGHIRNDTGQTAPNVDVVMWVMAGAYGMFATNITEPAPTGPIPPGATRSYQMCLVGLGYQYTSVRALAVYYPPN